MEKPIVPLISNAQRGDYSGMSSCSSSAVATLLTSSEKTKAESLTQGARDR